MLAAPPFVVGLIGTWRLVWPRWKLPGKGVAYFAGVAVLSSWIGHWSVALAWAHQALGLGLHVWFCRHHGLSWYAPDPEVYVARSKQMLGLSPEPSPARSPPAELFGVPLPVPRTLQHEGEPAATIEHVERPR